MSAPAELSPPLTRATAVRHFVLAALLAITVINYMQRNCISPLYTTIEEKLGISGVQLDLAGGAFFLAYTLFQVPSGWLAQRWGSRATLPLYAFGWSLALAGCAFASSFPELYAGRLAMGAFQAGIFPCATLILAVWYPASQRGLATALLNSCMLIGSAGGMMLAGYLNRRIDWWGVFLAYSLPGVVWSVWFLWWFRNQPREHPGVNQEELDLIAGGPRPPAGAAAPRGRDEAAEAIRAGGGSDVQPAGGQVAVGSPAPPQPPAAPAAVSGGIALAWVPLLSLPLLLLCTQQGFRAAANRLFDSRLPTYLEKERGASKEWAATLASLPQWAGVVGGVLGGSLSDLVLRRTRSRRWARNGVALGSLAVSVLLYLAAYPIADVTLAMLVFSLGAFVFCFSSPCAYALCIDVGGRQLAVVFGLMNMIGNLGAYVFVSSVMFTVRLGGWELALGLWIGLHLAAIVCWLFLDPNVAIGRPDRKE